MLTALSIAPPASAVELAEWLYGDWCEANGGRLIINEYGIGFNEHTVCDLLDSRSEGAAVYLDIKCASVYPNGDEVVRMDERVVHLKADRARIEVEVEGGSPTIFRRCDD